jgi:hypothetical protein
MLMSGVKTRACLENDWDELRRIHSAQQMPYEFPDLSNPLFLTKVVAETGGKIAAASFLRLTAEAYLLVDREYGAPTDRWRAVTLLHEVMRGEAARRGFDDVHCWLPPQIAGAFGRRLGSLGWKKEPWDCYARTVFEATPMSKKTQGT